MKKKALWLAISSICVAGLTGVVLAQPSVDGNPSSVNSTVKDAEKPAFMQAMDIPGYKPEQMTQTEPETALNPTTINSGALKKIEPPDAAIVHPVPVHVLPMTTGGGLMANSPPSGLTLEEKRYFDEQARLQRETSIMEARVKLAEQQAKYNETMGKMLSESSVQSASSVKESRERKIETHDPAQELILVSVFGEGKRLEGEVFYRGGRISIKRGDKLPGGLVVSSIEPTRIIVTKGKQKSEITLGYPPKIN